MTLHEDLENLLLELEFNNYKFSRMETLEETLKVDRKLKFLDSMKDVNLCCIYCRRVIRCYNEVNEQ